jgi:hypothetical protein
MEEVASKMLGQFSGRLEKLVLDGPPEDSSTADAADETTGPRATQADGGTAPRAASSASPVEDEEVLDLGAAMLGGGAGKLVAGGLGIGLLAALLGLLFKRRSRRGFSFSISYRA